MRGSGKVGVCEFIAGMYLITRIKSGLLSAPPQSLPDFFWKMINTGMPTNQSNGSSSFVPTEPNMQTQNSSLTQSDRKQYELFFDQLDSNKQGFINGTECVNFFKKSSLNDTELSNIWYALQTKNI